MSDIDALLDATLDEIDDLPEFVTIPKGMHKVLATFKMGTNKDKPSVKLMLTYLETLELADPEAVAPAPGSMASVNYLLTNEYGLGNFKKVAAPFREALGLNTNRDIIDGVKDVEVAIETSLRADKNKEDVLYLEIKDLVVQ